LDTKRHLGFRGAYLPWMALPDRWVTWLVGAIPAGLLAIRRFKVDVILSTFPTPTAVLVGLLLRRLTRKPWIVDLRDSMTEENYPSDKRQWRVWRWLERQVVRHASIILVTTPSARQMYLERYPTLSPGACLVISNGYDEEDFESLRFSGAEPAQSSRTLKLLHTGIIYPEERDPRPFFRALSRLKREGRIDASSLTIDFRAPGSEQLYQSIMHDLDIEDLIQLQPHVLYHQSLQECANADGLLLFQAANCDHQIPAKAYEYLRVRKPIYALTTQTGDTAALLREVGGATIAELASEENIYKTFPPFLDAIRAGNHPLPDLDTVKQYARRNQAAELAKLLDRLLNSSLLALDRQARDFAG
jgi:glycosyltransferase involved in cell wall biosynthesis